jgi:hypothetical protein
LRKFILWCSMIMVLSFLFAGCGKEEKSTEAVAVENAEGIPGDIYTDHSSLSESSINESAAVGTVKGPTNPAFEESPETEKEDSCIMEDPEFIMPEKGVRPIAVMIDNEGTKPLPQGGLEKAQVIYEAVVEFGITRIMAMFWNVAPDMIGPVRSARHYFLDYSMEHDAIYVHVGWSPMAERDISKYAINNINGIRNGGWIFHDITDDPYNWQDTYTSMDKILQYSKNAGYSLETERAVFRI